MRLFEKKKSAKLYKTTAIVLVFTFLLGVLGIQGEPFYATLEDNKNQATSELEDLNSELEGIQGEQEETKNELDETTALLSDILVDKEILEKDIIRTQLEIEATQLALEEAKRVEEQGHEAMIARIQYMYQNSTRYTLWDAILNASSLTDFLNRIEFIVQIQKTDRMLMEEYTATVEKVENLAKTQQENMDNLLTMQENLDHQQEELELVMADLKQNMENYDAQIAAAEARAAELVEYIEEQNRLIKEEERKRKEEEERKRKEEERKKKEEERKKKEEEERKKKEEEEKKKQEEDKKKEEDKNKEEYVDTNPDVLSGEDVVAYALKFVGNPYKWGGNSLTEGCDCSGFVNLIYKHFGFKGVPRQSQSFKYYGVKVSYSEIQPGDIVVYPGHVAIYMGNGLIVEAQNSRNGITCNRSVTCGTITAIRRVIGYEERD